MKDVLVFKTWIHSAQDSETLARALEAHLNEFAGEVLDVSYAVADGHHVLAVYRAIEISTELPAEAAVSVAEHIIDEAQS